MALFGNLLKGTVSKTHPHWQGFFGKSNGFHTTGSEACNKSSSSLPSSEQVDWKAAKEKFLNMELEEKRTLYACKGRFLALENIRPWPVYFDKNKAKLPILEPKLADSIKNPINFTINNRMTIGLADITTLEVDVIVNSAARDLKGGGGAVDKAIHEAAGPELLEECNEFHGVDIGDARISGGYRLPAKYVIHTAGPKTENHAQLAQCYKSSLQLMKEHRLSTIAFPCISTSSSGYPGDKAALIALYTARKFLNKNPDKPHRIVFCVYSDDDLYCYERLAQAYFPME